MADTAPPGATPPNPDLVSAVTVAGPIPEGSLVLFSGIDPDYEDQPALPAQLAAAVAAAAGHHEFVVFTAPVTAGVAVIDAATALEELRTALSAAAPDALEVLAKTLTIATMTEEARSELLRELRASAPRRSDDPAVCEALDTLGVVQDSTFWERYHLDPAFHYAVRSYLMAWAEATGVTGEIPEPTTDAPAVPAPTTDRLALIVPSRGRPRNIDELIDALAATSSSITDLYVAVDDDDPALPLYRSVCADRFQSVNLVVGPRVRLGPTLNTVALRAAHAGYRWVGFMGDDHRPRTVDWDRAMTAACGSFGMAYADDLFQSENLPTEIVMTSNIVTALGHMSLPGLVHMFIDNYWLTLGQALQCITYLPDVVVEHVHPAAGKAELDHGYGEAMGVFEDDRAVFDAWCSYDGPSPNGLETEVSKLMEVRDGSAAV